MTQVYKEITLIKAVGSITSVAIRFITEKRRAEIAKGFDITNPDFSDDQRDREISNFYRAVILELTDLNAEDIKNLAKPDYNSIFVALNELMVFPSEKISLSKNSTSVDRDVIHLLSPVRDEAGKLVDCLKMVMPTVGQTDIAEAQSDEDERTKFLTSACIEPKLEDPYELSVPDWRSVQGRISDFLNETGDYFSTATAS